MNGFELKRQRYWNWSQSKILALSIVGNTDTLETLKLIMEKSGHTNNIELLNTTQMLIESEQITSKLNNKSEDEQKAIIEELSKTEFAKLGIAGDIEKTIKAEFEKAPEYIKNNVQSHIEEVNTKSIETTTGGIINEIINGPTAKAALPAWLAGFGSVVGWITFRLNYYVWWHVSKVCLKQWLGCLAIAMQLVDNANTIDDIRRKFQNL